MNAKAGEKTLILGVGNVLMGNEGVGVKAVEFLRDQDLPGNAVLLDGGTGGFHLLGLFYEYSRIILIDATLNSGTTGEIRVLKPKFGKEFPRSLSSHDVDVFGSARFLIR